MIDQHPGKKMAWRLRQTRERYELDQVNIDRLEAAIAHAKTERVMLGSGNNDRYADQALTYTYPTATASISNQPS